MGPPSFQNQNQIDVKNDSNYDERLRDVPWALRRLQALPKLRSTVDVRPSWDPFGVDFGSMSDNFPITVGLIFGLNWTGGRGVMLESDVKKAPLLAPSLANCIFIARLFTYLLALTD